MRIFPAIRKNYTIFLCAAVMIAFSLQLSGQGKFSFEFLPGGAVIIPSTLTICQEGYPDLRFSARYRSESLIFPIYYSCRFGYKITDKSTIELELNHLKVLLDNNPPEIEEFFITHGFNQLWANYAVIYKGFVFRAGIGAVFAHPESTIRGMKFDADQGYANLGYYVSGITSQLAVQKKFYFWKYFYLSAEAKLNAAYAQVKIVDGFARIPVYALNGLIGLGISF
jgi:hypothetical protein